MNVRTPDPNLAHIGFDADGVFHPYITGFWNTLRQIGHPAGNLPEPPVTTAWYFHEPYMTDDDYHAVVNVGSDTGTLYGSASPIPRSRDAMNLLHDAGHRITIITARDTGTVPGFTLDTTRRWLARWGFRYDDVIVAEDKTCVPTDLFIEDRAKNYDALEAAGTRSFLITYPYNDEPDARRRVTDAWHFARSVVGTRVEDAHMTSPEPTGALA